MILDMFSHDFPMIFLCPSGPRYAVGEDGCLRVQPLPTADPRDAEKPVARRNFRISPMPLSALAAAW